MAKSWSADQEKPGSLTSIDVLVRWLQIPGKYKSLKSGSKKELIQEIASEIKKHKASTRSPSAIRRMILKLELQYEEAMNWLRSEGHLDEYLNGESGDDVKKQVMERCPLFHEVSAAFQSIEHNGDSKAKEEDTKEDTSEEVVDKMVEIGTAPTAQKKRKRDSQEVDEKSIKKRKTSEVPVVHVDPVVKNPIDENHPARHKETSLVLAQFRKESESRWTKYCGVNIPTYSGETRDKVTEQILQREMEHTDAMAKLQFEQEQKRQELHTKCIVALSRHKLRSAGLSEEDVDSTIPK
ncbi:hypothetical protein PHMEG_00033243 [Phytophthora megakarya]|uniref:Uncharacterized protein n=1 Tax=Phytophthora megakarya TaxID=4795 RepID=A0A225UTP8_9STRA|nr:hypothetical protein PHMEG_00033243 [Phytophthora megakarya]